MNEVKVSGNRREIKYMTDASFRHALNHAIAFMRRSGMGSSNLVEQWEEIKEGLDEGKEIIITKGVNDV